MLLQAAISRRLALTSNALYQEFNTFQQALNKEALDEASLMQIFPDVSTTAISFEMFTALYRRCTAADMLVLFQKLGLGTCAITVFVCFVQLLTLGD